MSVSKTSNHIQIKIRVTNPTQEPPASSKAPNEDLDGKYLITVERAQFLIMVKGKNS